MVQPWSAEQMVSQSLARQLIKEQFPQLAVTELTLLGEGFDNTVYRVDGCYVFRFPRRAIAVDLLKTENNILPNLVPYLPIKIPEPLFFGNPTDIYPWSFTGYRLVKGKTPGRLDNLIRLKSAKLLAEFLRALHKFPVQKAKEFAVPITDSLRRLDILKRKQQLEKYVEQLKTIGLWNHYSVLEKFLSSLRGIEYKDMEMVVHGDLHFRNLLVDNDGVLSGIIDWGDVHIGHPAIDLAIVYSFLPLEGRTVFYDIYGNVDDETKELARFRAVYTAVVLLLYSHDLGDEQMVKAAEDSLRLSLME